MGQKRDRCDHGKKNTTKVRLPPSSRRRWGPEAPPLGPGSESCSTSSERGHGLAIPSEVFEREGVSVGQGSPRPSAMSRNLRTALIFGGFVSLIGAAFYPIYFRPLMKLEEYQKEQAINRAGIVQEDVQPPGLKVWSDPFGRK
ncbi:small integral membrane protein 20 [Otolemur garnettii]|uniref:small integral membrane protein 20 n=2 Tax=Lorisiformes TaxID=376917 RepID=UPI000644661D|nr:small integral membrane protein 20 [Otolemur garnettii]